MTNKDPYARLMGRLRELSRLASVQSLLSWDQETMMPPRAAPFRAEQLSLVATLVHERLTDPKVGELLTACEEDHRCVGDPVKAANLRECRRDHDRAVRLPTALVAEISETSSRALEAWKQARENDDFPSFRPWLEKQIELQRKKAGYLGPPEGGELYDALLDEYEPGMKAREVERLFEPLRQATAPLIARIAESPRRPDPAFLRIAVPIEQQKEFNLTVARELGYDLEAGRLDVSTHPFTEGLGPGDTRITTRYREDGVVDTLASTLHETGHALYEQGLPKERYPGQPLSGAASLAIHESQSRLWENQVGRSLAFWEWALPLARRVMGEPLQGFGVEEAYRAVNTVEPNLIRVESDEATYNLHIMLRFDLEAALIRGDLAATDLPSAWNHRIEQDLGLKVPDDRTGCLQDIHWSLGAFGYFPTYTLGNLYAAQIWDTMRTAIDDVERRVGEGRFSVLLDWLRSEVHVHGRRYSARELGRRVTGKELGHAPLVRYLEEKFRPIYGI